MREQEITWEGFPSVLGAIPGPSLHLLSGLGAMIHDVSRAAGEYGNCITTIGNDDYAATIRSHATAIINGQPMSLKRREHILIDDLYLLYRQT